MEFNANNMIVGLCMKGMAMEEQNKVEEASLFFLQAWNEATSDFEKFLAAYYVAQRQEKVSDKLNWLQTTLDLALKIDDDGVKPAFGLLYQNIAKCYEDLNDSHNSEKSFQLASLVDEHPSDIGPFYHGTKADLAVGDFLTPGYNSNYKSDLVMNHIYFTAMMGGAGLAAALAKGEGRDRIYVVEPTGGFENDPNVTNKKFPGNPTRSYRTDGPLKIVAEVTNWQKQTPEELQNWRDKLANNKGKIIN
ncbi:MAG: NAD(+)--rifampin ADP-ribosyltransferase [Chitinophagaceae bacterium]|nr:MAG: NAD(+)--rifampin ADP-ribosyltransferase [Chitinophagaceae bacterium]